MIYARLDTLFMDLIWMHFIPNFFPVRLLANIEQALAM